MTAEKKQYNYCLDFLKGIACVFVVFMHCEFPGIMGTAVQAISRFCVPFFFMVSGYYCYKPLIINVNGEGWGYNPLIIRKKLLHVGKITLYASLFYLAFVLLQQVFFHNQNISISKNQLFSWVVFNQPSLIAGQYWFLFALLYAYALYSLLERFGLRKVEYISAAILFLVYIAMAQGAHLAGVKIPNLYYRNWLIEAFPYFMLGHWIHENQERITISNKALITIIVVTTLLCWVERWIMGRDFGVNIVTIPQVFALFVYGVKNPTSHEGFVQRLGRDCSMLVYILHPAIWHSIDAIYYKANISDILSMQYLKPIFVLTLSIVFAILFNYIMASIKTRKQYA